MCITLHVGKADDFFLNGLKTIWSIQCQNGELIRVYFQYRTLIQHEVSKGSGRTMFRAEIIYSCAIPKLMKRGYSPSFEHLRQTSSCSSGFYPSWWGGVHYNVPFKYGGEGEEVLIALWDYPCEGYRQKTDRWADGDQRCNDRCCWLS